jgi:hypothetical protein
MRWLLLGAFLGLLAAVPQLATLALAALGTAMVWAAAQPPLIAFTAGILAGPHITTRMLRGTA